MKKVKFGIVGYGAIGKRHFEKIIELDDAEVVAICDVKQEELDSVKNKPIFLTQNCKELLKRKDIDVVVVSTPNYLHHKITIESLESGKNVLCEKPMALSVKECNKMIKASQISNTHLFIVKQNRFNPPVKYLKKLIGNGTLGEIFLIVINCFWNRNELYYQNSDWKGKLDLDGGTLFTQFSHFVDLLYFLCGDVVSVNAIGNNFSHKGIEFEDTGVVTFELANNGIGTINYTTCSYEKNMEGSFTVFAENGTVKIGGEYLNTLEYFNVKDTVAEDFGQETLPNDYGFYKGSMSNHDKVIKNVVRTLRGEEVVATSAFEGMKTVQIIEAIYESMKTSKIVRIR